MDLPIKKIENGILDVLKHSHDDKMSNLFMRSDININIECFYINKSIHAFNLMKCYFEICILTQNIQIKDTFGYHVKKLVDTKHENNDKFIQALKSLFRIDDPNANFKLIMSDINLQTYLLTDSSQLAIFGNVSSANKYNQVQLQSNTPIGANTQSHINTTINTNAHATNINDIRDIGSVGRIGNVELTNKALTLKNGETSNTIDIDTNVIMDVFDNNNNDDCLSKEGMTHNTNSGIGKIRARSTSNSNNISELFETEPYTPTITHDHEPQ